MRFRLLALLTLLCAFSLVFAACGGDDDSGSENGDTSESRDEETPEDTENTPADSEDSDEPDDADPATPTPEEVGDGNGDSGVTGSGADALRELAQDLEGKTYQVTYDFNSESAGESIVGTMTIAQRPPQTATRFAFDEGITLVITDEESTVFCTSSPDGSDGQCLRSTVPPPTPGVFDIDDAMENIDSSVDVTEVDGQEIAGREARCFEVTQEGETGVICFDEDEGILLLVEQTAGEAFTIRATDVQTSVDDSLFEPPYEVLELPTGQETPEGSE